jgi:3-deoxy-D-manno-octulosonate 8-phosphate phosphatase (KDO 8-P phosphatase)
VFVLSFLFSRLMARRRDVGALEDCRAAFYALVKKFESPHPNGPFFMPTAQQPPCCFILDVDGVMTPGTFFYSAEGKVLKAFGPDDHDGLSLLRPYLEIRFVTGDKKGYPISKRRIVDDMGFPLDVVSTIRRIDWIRDAYDPARVVYMGDGIFDPYVMREVGYAIAPANADANAKAAAHFVTARAGGDRAVAEACLHLLETFFTPYDPARLPAAQGKMSGEWTV